MNKTKILLLRAFMLFGGLILIAGGLLAISLSEEKINVNLIIDKLVFFLSGGILIFLGFTWKRKEINDADKK